MAQFLHSSAQVPMLKTLSLKWQLSDVQLKWNLSKNSYTAKCRCNERQYNEMFRIVKLCLGPFPFPYLMCVKTFHFNKFRTFSITN